MGSDKQKSELTKWEENEKQKQEEELAKVEVWKYVFGFVEMAVVKCAIELGIADAIESHGRAMTVQELSSTLGCASQTLHRVMRFLANRGIFREVLAAPPNDDVASKRYAQTPLSRLFMRTGEGNMAALLLLESSPPMLAPWHALSARVAGGGGEDAAPVPFEVVHGEDVWRYAAANAAHCRLINEAMACNARVAMAAVVEGCLDVFDGVRSVVDVGGGTGTALRKVVEACRPRIRGVNFDLPHVVADAEECEGVEHVGGDMFEFVPKADVAFLMWVLHDWSDDECIQILKKCKEAIPKDKGKVIIVEAVIEKHQNNKEDKLKDVGLVLDMVMMSHTAKGKERTLEEWTYVLREAGFPRHTVRSIAAVQSVIEAFPA